MSLVELKVPDIGNYQNVDIIAVEIKPGDTVAVDDTLITLETDKATMDVPSEVAGVVKEVKVKVGDKISEGGLIAVVESKAKPVADTTPAATTEPQATALKAAAYQGQTDKEYDVVVLGGGPGGYSAAFAAADQGLKVAIVERYNTLGGVCLNVGCIPSKALLHNAAIIDEARELAANGIKFNQPQIDIEALRAYKEKVVGKMTGGLAAMAKMRQVDIIRGNGHYLDPHHIEVAFTSGSGSEENGQKTVVAFKNSIIAAGSRVVNLPFIPEDKRIVDSTGALELRFIPKKC